MTDFKVYLIYNKVDTKDSNTYVGCTRQTIRERFQEHKADAHQGSHMVVHKYMREVGIRNFDIKLLEKYDSGCKEEKESNWISLVKSTLNYNRLSLHCFPSRREYKQYWRKQNILLRKYVCSDCDNAFTEGYNLRKHKCPCKSNH